MTITYEPDINLSIAAGSIPGRPHLLAGRPNQDAVHHGISQDGLVAVICDGCSSGLRSEVGAGLGAPLIVRALQHQLPRMARLSEDDTHGFEVCFETARQDVLAHLRVLLGAMPGSRSKLVEDYFLFTVLAAVVTNGCSVVAAIGDGLGGFDGTLDGYGPFPNNAPPYLAYGGLVHSSFDGDRNNLGFQIIAAASTRDISHVTIASDGAADLIEAHRMGLQIPHRDEPVPDFWYYSRDPALWRNPDMLRRRLAVLSPPPRPIRWPKDEPMPIWPTIVKDDTTIVAVAINRAPVLAEHD